MVRRAGTFAAQGIALNGSYLMNGPNGEGKAFTPTGVRAPVSEWCRSSCSACVAVSGVEFNGTSGHLVDAETECFLQVAIYVIVWLFVMF